MIWNEESLRKMSENDLCLTILIPLFEAMGYRDVEYYHGGALEQGKDLIMWREEPIKGRVNYAAVVKAKKITGAASQGMHEILMQIKQCLDSVYVNKKTLEKEMVHQCFLVSSHEIKKEGTHSFHSLLSHEKLLGRVFPIDGKDLWALVQQHLPQHAIHARLNDAYKELEGFPHPDYEVAVVLKPGERRFEFMPKHEGAAPLPISLIPSFPSTKQGRRKKAEFEKSFKTGARVELTQEHVPFKDLPEPIRMLFPFAKDQPYTIVIGPSRLESPIPVILSAEAANGAPFTLPWLEFTEISGGVESYTLSNDSQAMPLKVRLTISKVDRRVNLSYTFNFEGQSVFWLVQAVRLQRVLTAGALVVLRDLRTGLALPSFKVPPGKAESWSEGFLSIAESILDIQDVLKRAVLIPDRPYFTDLDVLEVERFKDILATGTIASGVEDLRVTFFNRRGFAKEFLKLLESEPEEELLFQEENYFVSLLDQQIPLGPVEVRIKSPRLHAADLELLRACASGKARPKEISLRLMAAEGKSIEVKFHRWPKVEANPQAVLAQPEESSGQKERPRRPRREKTIPVD